MRPLRFLGVAVFAVALAPPAPSNAQIAPRTCGVLDGPSCTPHLCTVLDGPGCVTEAQFGIGAGLQRTLRTRAATGVKTPDGQLNTWHDLIVSLGACLKPPAPENAYPEMQMSMRFSLNREGRLIGPPRITYATHEVGQRTRDLYRDAFTQSLQACMPLPLTKGFAAAVAGRPIFVRIVDDRDEVARAKPRI